MRWGSRSRSRSRSEKIQDDIFEFPLFGRDLINFASLIGLMSRGFDVRATLNRRMGAGGEDFLELTEEIIEINRKNDFLSTQVNVCLDKNGLRALAEVNIKFGQVNWLRKFIKKRIRKKQEQENGVKLINSSIWLISPRDIEIISDSN